MATFSEAERIVQALEGNELDNFRAWFGRRQADAWNEDFEADVLAGRLKALRAEALHDLRTDRCTDW